MAGQKSGVYCQKKISIILALDMHLAGYLYVHVYMNIYPIHAYTTFLCAFDYFFCWNEYSYPCGWISPRCFSAVQQADGGPWWV